MSVLVSVKSCFFTLVHFALSPSYVYFCLLRIDIICYQCSCLHLWILKLKKYSSYHSLCCYILLETDYYLLTLINIWVCLSMRTPWYFWNYPYIHVKQHINKVADMRDFSDSSFRKWPGLLITRRSSASHIFSQNQLSNFDWVSMKFPSRQGTI